MCEPKEDIYLAYMNTLKENEYITYSKISNNKEQEITDKIDNRNDKISNILSEED